MKVKDFNVTLTVPEDCTESDFIDNMLDLLWECTSPRLISSNILGAGVVRDADPSEEVEYSAIVRVRGVGLNASVVEDHICSGLMSAQREGFISFVVDSIEQEVIRR